MTARQVFEYALIELNKVQAPSLLLEDYNYFINKAINQYVNKVYNMYDVNQQKSDDVRVLKATAVLRPEIQSLYDGKGQEQPKSSLLHKTYEVNLPDDYFHILNCVVEYTVKHRFKCYDQGDKVHFGATRLTSDMFSQIINNYYMRPSYKMPYFYINNVNTKNDYEAGRNEENWGTKDSQDGKDGYIKYPTKLKILNPNRFLPGQQEFIWEIRLDPGTEPIYKEITNRDNVERIAPNRYGNKNKVRMELRYGKDDSTFTLSQVYVDYLKAPQFIRLTQDQVDTVQDTSQVIEFQDYVCQEIVNELVTLLMENASDPRLQTQIPINQSIAGPQQEGAQQQKQ